MNTQKVCSNHRAAERRLHNASEIIAATVLTVAVAMVLVMLASRTGYEITTKSGTIVTCEFQVLGVFKQCSDGFNYPQSEVSEVSNR